MTPTIMPPGGIQFIRAFTANPLSIGAGNLLARIAYCMLCAFIIALPWGESFPIFGGLLFASWLGFLAFGITAVRIVITGQARRLSPLHYSILGFVAWVILSVLWTSDWDSTVTRATTFLQLTILVWLIWEVATTESRVRGLLLCYIIGSLLASGMTLSNYLTGHTAAQLAATHGMDKWETSRYSVSGTNENDLGLMLALSIAPIFYLLVSAKGTVVKLICWLQLVAGIVAILLTASRGALVSAAAGFMMFPLTLSRLPRRQRLVAFIAFTGLLACGIYLVPPTSWSRIFTFGSEISQGTLTHRTVLWAAGLETFRDHAFLGVGAGAYGASILRIVDIPYVAHNTFLSVLVELGVAGALLLSILLAGIFYCVVRMRYLERCLWITLLLTWMIGVSALTWDYRKPTWLLFGLVTAHIYSRRAEESRFISFTGSYSAVAVPGMPLKREVFTERV
jgi:O-antigen ligase